MKSEGEKSFILKCMEQYCNYEDSYEDVSPTSTPVPTEVCYIQ